MASYQASQASPPKAQAEAPATPDFDEQLNKLVTEYGEEAAAPFKALLSRQEQLERDIAQQRELLTQQREEMHRAEGASFIQGHIDARPTLKQWQEDARAFEAGDLSKNAGPWTQSLMVEDWLQKNDPAYRELSYDERFAKVEATVQQALGSPSQAAPAAAPADRQKAVEAAITKAAQTPIESLSDLAVGGAPVRSEGEKIANMSAWELTQQYENMTPEQRDQLLASHASLMIQ